MSKGASLGEAISAEHRIKTVTYKGITYTSLMELCTTRGVSYNMVLRRLSKGMLLEQAIETKVELHSFTIDGVTFSNVKHLCGTYGFMQSLANKLVPNHEMVEYILNYRENNPDQFTSRGIKFKTLRLAKQTASYSNRLYVFKPSDDAFELISIETLKTDEAEAVSSMFNSLETILPSNNEIETEIIKSEHFIYGQAEVIPVSVGTDKLYLAGL